MKTVTNIKCPECGMKVPDIQLPDAEYKPYEEILCNACWEIQDKAIHAYQAEKYKQEISELNNT
jgi:endogenous inhibitor of DNA gyrase (YacG/DUF329 family)